MIDEESSASGQDYASDRSAIGAGCHHWDACHLWDARVLWDACHHWDACRQSSFDHVQMTAWPK